jgi:hypothetical protein
LGALPGSFFVFLRFLFLLYFDIFIRVALIP